MPQANCFVLCLCVADIFKPPMKRHPSLVPLSREHHQMLLLAQLCKRDAPPYKGLPTDLPGKIAYATEVWHRMVENHFLLEEQAVFAETAKHATLGDLTHELLDEHDRIRKQWEGVQQFPENEEVLDTFGRLLESHIRKEEREFFQQLQAEYGEEALQIMGKKIGG